MKIKEIRDISAVTRVHEWCTEYFLGGISIILSSYLRTRLLQGTQVNYYVSSIGFKVKWNFPEYEALL